MYPVTGIQVVSVRKALGLVNRAGGVYAQTGAGLTVPVKKADARRTLRIERLMGNATVRVNVTPTGDVALL